VASIWHFHKLLCFEKVNEGSQLASLQFFMDQQMTSVFIYDAQMKKKMLMV